MICGVSPPLILKLLLGRSRYVKIAALPSCFARANAKCAATYGEFEQSNNGDGTPPWRGCARYVANPLSQYSDRSYSRHISSISMPLRGCHRCGSLQGELAVQRIEELVAIAVKLGAHTDLLTELHH